MKRITLTAFICVLIVSACESTVVETPRPTHPPLGASQEELDAYVMQLGKSDPRFPTEEELVGDYLRAFLVCHEEIFLKRNIDAELERRIIAFSKTDDQIKVIFESRKFKQQDLDERTIKRIESKGFPPELYAYGFANVPLFACRINRADFTLIDVKNINW